MTVALGSPTSKFSGAVDPATKKIAVSGNVRGSKPFINKIGTFDVDLALDVRTIIAAKVVTSMIEAIVMGSEWDPELLISRSKLTGQSSVSLKFTNSPTIILEVIESLGPHK